MNTYKITENDAGVAVEFLDEIAGKLKAISREDYERMSNNAREISKKLRAGYYLKRAIDACI